MLILQAAGNCVCAQGNEAVASVESALLFASLRIEREVAASADRLEVLPRLIIPVATTAHLIASKVLAERSQDLTDLGYLIPEASPADLSDAREAVKLIQTRGFNREQDVVADLEQLVADSSSSQL